ncbi:MAG: hypothetical protein JRE58_06390 [Deltaproteobacteria bacterium]|nr:hypothetical protein [Deltaproteobacteria bacterium]
MSVAPDVDQSFESKLHEAETCHAMGLLEEALVIYEHILMDLPSLENEQQQKIKLRINALKKELDSPNMETISDLSSRDLSIIKQTLGRDKNFSTPSDRAAAFLELGLMTEAAREYEKAFDAGYDDISTVLSFAQCLLMPVETAFDFNGCGSHEEFGRKAEHRRDQGRGPNFVYAGTGGGKTEAHRPGP